LHLVRTASIAAAAALISACSTPPAIPSAASPPGAADYLKSPTGCAIVAGGGVGSLFADKQVTAMWDKVNAAVTTELHDRLVQQQYKVVKVLVPTERTRKAEDLMLSSLASNRCNRLLQVSHKVDEDAAGKYFRFDIALLRIAPAADASSAADSITVRTAREFQREYRYPRTQESFDNFYTGTFAETVLADLTRSGTLQPLR
jgi:thiamine pyrophosphate-dependent acetolactate synthase large subunit-like protein